ncbi:MAG: hypothetical protein RR272_00315 [Synergistaceae bacterium]
MSFSLRSCRLVFGLFLYAVGIFLSIRANIGLAPWDAFTIGICNLTGFSYGWISISIGVVILVLDYFMNEMVGYGTILNIFLIGWFVDLLVFLNLVPYISNFFLGVLVLLLGQVVISFGSYFYIGAAFGCGPRDFLMVALGKRLPKLPIGVVRGMIESTVLFMGFMMNAKVGLGTVIAACGISFIMQYVFSFLHFDVKGVKHETLGYTLRNHWFR